MTADATEALTIAPLSIEPDEIARFIAKVYDQHPHGKSFVPRWSGAFLKHIIFDDPQFTPDHALGAYLRDQLVGLIMAQPYAVHMDGRRVAGAYGSWLAVTPQGAGQFAAIKLLHELRTRLAAQGAEFMVGVAYRSGPGVGLDFWESYARAFPKDISPGRDLTYWARVLDGGMLAAAVKDPLLKLGGFAARLRPVSKPSATADIRAFAGEDLERCQQLLAEAPAQMRTAPSLWELQPAPSLDEGPQTLVLDRGAGAEAVSMFHVLPMSDARPLRVGMIEHLVCPGSSRDRQRLLAATLWRLKQHGACLALLPQKPYIGSAEMLLAGFVPYDGHFKIFTMPLSDNVPPQMPASYDLLVR
ncbi:MAG TPA: GNAT family N-acetyltransferase [Methyloceanibacter sp.]|nr:GNAT family N-acetyltransferase [Methyloceanibacter sp.]